ncbi:hypothetical protein SKAU_G00387190 [Synaphobranchus kaupii]|uniref:CCHC-type domain-containing protein n=1 Tax=Synaphobranchus kaupii TaxID=118154 RepID=A0A9Q1EAW8_SYNKA|nr:hypothetical protein SKAU_G00387190 [Synaphobranchus kaupii]
MESDEQSAPRAGLRNTARFLWRKADGGIMPREGIGKEVLLGALKLKMAEVLCLQSNISEHGFDVTFSTSKVCMRVLAECRRLATERLMSHFEVMSLDKANFRLITTHMYNPHVSDQVVAAFMRGYGEVLTGARRRGYCLYSGQPPFCRKCRAQGHWEQVCGPQRCRVCKEEGHVAKNFPIPKTCHGCGETGHLIRSCTKAAPVPAKGPDRQEKCPQGGKEQPEAVREEVPEPEGGKAPDGPAGEPGGGPVPEPEPKSNLAPGPSEGPDPAAGGLAATGQNVAVFPLMLGGGFLRAFKYVPKVNEGMLTAAAVKAMKSLSESLATEMPKVQKGLGGENQMFSLDCLLKRRAKEYRPALPGRPFARKGGRSTAKREKNNGASALEREGVVEEPHVVEGRAGEPPAVEGKVGVPAEKMEGTVGIPAEKMEGAGGAPTKPPRGGGYGWVHRDWGARPDGRGDFL